VHYNLNIIPFIRTYYRPKVKEELGYYGPVTEMTMIEFEQDEFEQLATIKVIGVGGGGSNAVKRMIEESLTGVDFYVVNTDLQALRTCQNATQVAIGKTTTNGLGAGADAEKGRKAAEEDKDSLKEIVEGGDMIFVTAGMGGGTGTGAGPIIANLAKESGALTIGVVTRPFDFEGQQRSVQAEVGLEEMRIAADSVIVIPNQRLLEVTDRAVTIPTAFRMGDEILHHAVKSISDLILFPGEINLDFADVRAIMQDGGSALMGIGNAAGDNRAETAAKKAISSPLLEETHIKGATGIIVGITCSSDMLMHELEDAMDVIRGASDTEQIFFGLTWNEDLQEELRVTVIATGFDEHRRLGMGMPEDSVVGLNNFLGPGHQRTSPSDLPGSVPPNTPRQFTPQGQQDTMPNPRAVPEQRRNTPQQGRNDLATNPDEVTEDVLDIPAFLRVRDSRDKK
jgi:cell division protein FtsZ